MVSPRRSGMARWDARLSSSERLSDALYVRMTPREREVLDKEARRRGVTASELVRELVRAADYGRISGAKKSKPVLD